MFQGNVEMTLEQVKDKLGEKYPAVKEKYEAAREKMDAMIQKLSTITLKVTFEYFLSAAPMAEKLLRCSSRREGQVRILVSPTTARKKMDQLIQKLITITHKVLF